jgi:hypothetical protein
MPRKIVLWLAILVSIAGWPISLLVNPQKLEIGFVWQLGDAGEERKILFQKLALDASPIKRIFYNNKTTIISDRYTKNILSLVNPNNYFFGDMKFPYPAAVGFLVGVYVSIKEKKHFKLWLYGCGAILLMSFLKKLDGWDLAAYPLLAVITIDGLKEIHKHKFGWLLLLLIAVVGLIEIGRILP